MAEMGAVLLAFFIWGLARGLSTCLFLCAPGMVSIMVNERAGMLRSLRLGLVLSLPRILLLTSLGAVLGLAGFEALGAVQARDAVWWISLGAYVLLGLLLVGVGLRLLGGGGGAGRSARTRFWADLAARVYPESGKSDRLFLLWGGVLSLACLAEVGLLEGVAAGAVSGGEPSAGLSAGLGAALMFSLSLGATVPIMLAAAVSGGLVERVRSRQRLEFVKRVTAMLMVLLGLYFIFREAYTAITKLGWY